MSETKVVAKVDGRGGCPVTRWDDGVPFRCSLGVDSCYRHGPFEVERTTEETSRYPREEST